MPEPATGSEPPGTASGPAAELGTQMAGSRWRRWPFIAAAVIGVAALATVGVFGALAYQRDSSAKAHARAACGQVEQALANLDPAKLDQAAVEASKAAGDESRYAGFSSALTDAGAAAHRTDPSLLAAKDAVELVRVCGRRLTQLASTLQAAQQRAEQAAQAEAAAQAQQAAEAERQRQAAILASTPQGTIDLTGHRLTQACVPGGQCFGDYYLCASFHIQNTGQVNIGGLFGVQATDFQAVDPDGQVLDGIPPVILSPTAGFTPFSVGVQIVPGGHADGEACFDTHGKHGFFVVSYRGLGARSRCPGHPHGT